MNKFDQPDTYKMKKPMKKDEVIEKLADLIEANPECVFTIDNDFWNITVPGRDEYLATSDDFPCRPDWYSGGHLYGSALAAAMVVLLNRRGFKIIAGAC